MEKKQHKKPYKVMGAQMAPAGYGPSVMGAQMAPTGCCPPVMGAQIAPMGYGPSVMGAQTAPMGYGPSVMGAQMAPTKVAPAMVSPTQQMVDTNVFKTIVPHIHPTHTTHVNKHVFQHQHYFPHTKSVVNECYNQHLVCERPPMRGPFAGKRPFGF